MQLNKKRIFSKTAIIIVFSVAFIAVFGLFISNALAQDISLGIEYAEDLNLGSKDVREMVIDIVNVLLGFLGVLAILICLYGGYIWMTSGGESEKIAKAKKILINGVIGLLIILAALAIVNFLISQLAPTMSGPGSGSYAPGYNIGGGALGGGVLEAVYPEPGATDVPRNTLIMVMFNEDMDVSSVIQGSHPSCPASPPPNVICGHIAETAEPHVKINNQDEGTTVDPNEVMVITNDNRSFVFDPDEYLGNPNDYDNYMVELTTAVMRSNGFSAFTNGYQWSFQVSNILDLTPPHVTSVLPRPPQGQSVYMNAVVQINFNEAVNVVAATDPNNVYLTDQATGNPISGNLYISNQFKTLEFVSDQQCEQGGVPVINSCGEIPFCLPGNTDIRALIKAAEVDGDHNTTPLSLYFGVSDAAANSLDGGQGNESQANDPFCAVGLSQICNLNGQSDGRPPDSQDQFNENTFNDNYWWTFSTNDLMDLDPPEIITIKVMDGGQEVQKSLVPDKNAELIPINQTVHAYFDEFLMSSTINSTNFRVFNKDRCLLYFSPPNSVCTDPAELDLQGWPDEQCIDPPLSGECIYPRGGFSVSKKDWSNITTVSPPGVINESTEIILKTYSPYLDGLTTYTPRALSDIKDLYQNCFFPPTGP